MGQAVNTHSAHALTAIGVTASDLVPQIRRELRELHPGAPQTDVASATELIEETIAAPRFRTHILALFGSFTLILALVDIYRVIAEGVGERTREIALRIALV